MEKHVKTPSEAPGANTLDEIIFSEKNKDYGAYELRTSYLRTINRAFYLGTTTFVLAISIPLLHARFAPKTIDPDYTLAKVSALPPPETTPPPIVELPPPPPVEQPEAPSTRFLPPEIVTEVDPAEELPPTVQDLSLAPPSDKTVEGDPNVPIDVIIEDREPVETIVKLEPKEDETVFIVLEQEAEYPGGTRKLMEYLSENLRYPNVAINAGVGGKVFVNFLVDKYGKISDVKVSKGIGFSCDEEAIRVVKAMPNWNPGKQGGRPVNSRFNLPIVFKLE